MRVTLFIHILGGGLGIVSGFVALFARKGSTLHRKSGMLFVCAMVMMAVTGALIAALRGIEGSIIGGLLTGYLVVTALTTVRPRLEWTPRLEIALTLLALSIAVSSATMGLGIVTTGKRLDGIPSFPFLMFAVVALFATAGDVKILRAGGVTGVRRIRRHLWRMCFALWIAAASFFLGQAKVIPVSMRKPALLALPPLIVLVALLYWLWRTRTRRTGGDVVETTPARAA